MAPLFAAAQRQGITVQIEADRAANKPKFTETMMPRKQNYREIPKPKAGDTVSCGGRITGKLTRRRSFGDWEALGIDGKTYRVQGLAEVALLVLA